MVDKTGEAIIGANVKIQGTDKGTITGLDGNFTLEVAPKDVLIISYIGYLDVKVPIAGQNISMWRCLRIIKCWTRLL